MDKTVLFIFVAFSIFRVHCSKQPISRIIRFALHIFLRKTVVMGSQRQEIANQLPEIYPQLWRFCLVLTRDKPSADELTQSICARALEKSHLFKGDSNLLGWLFTMGRRLWINNRKAQAVRVGTGTIDAQDAGLKSNDLDQETNIFHSEVLSACMNLPEKQRETLILVYVEGFSYAEAAEILDVPTGTVMSRLASSRKTLKQMIIENHV